MHRRRLLGNAAALAAAAPFGPGLLAGAVRAADAPLRLLIFCRTNGISQKEGNFRLPSGPIAIPDGSALAPLRPFRDRLLVVSGMTYAQMKRANFGCHLADPFVLSARAATVAVGRWDGTGSSYYESTATASLDRFVAQRLPATPVPGIAIRDSSHKASLLTYVSYDGGPVAGRPNPTATADDPRRVWERLFGATVAATSPAARRQQQIDRLVASRLHEGYRRYAGRLAGSERAELEHHLAAVEAWRAKVAADAGGRDCKAPPAGDVTDLRSVAGFDLVTDMPVGAFRCDLTRVATFFWTGGSWTVPADRRGAAARGGSTDEHGGVGHSGDEAVRRCVDQWYVERFATVLGKLAAVPEGGGTMLDNTIVVMANRDPDHNSHSTGDLTWLIAGGGKRLATGQSLRWPSGAERKMIPHAQLLAALCAAMGVSPQGLTDEPPLRAVLG